jgi:error-prone DNA polymerase
VKDAQRHGVRFVPIDVQESDWECRVEPDGQVRLGLMYVNGLRAEAGRAIAQRLRRDECGQVSEEPKCPKCGCDDSSMLEATQDATYFCNVCANEWDSRTPSIDGRMAEDDRPRVADDGPRYTSIEELIARTRVRRDELATLAEIGALNSLGYDRRSALWQIEKAVRPAGELFEQSGNSNDRQHLSMLAGPHPRSRALGGAADAALHSVASRGPQALPHSGPRIPVSASRQDSPLRPMSPPERLMADYSGTSLTIGPHPMALRRAEFALRGVVRAVDLPRGRHGRRVRVAGAVITRQRPGTAKGFVFLTLEDETGIANIIVHPDLFTEYKHTIVGAPYLLVEGVLQIQEGVTSVKADRVFSLTDAGPAVDSHDFR